ncbi:hypothetical protein Plec18167_004082 [Paecilomyces lecythidis]|uniref:Uncharacterized protein n=1 Tax=Paecilomyces lecythidis TaxID=3004212 RepID=A0ABR3XVB3_9EURO
MALQPRSAFKATDLSTPEDIKRLERTGIFRNRKRAASTAGRPRMSLALNQPPIPSASSSSTPSVTFSFRGFYPNRSYISDIPTEQESVAALEWIGFEPSTAVKIFQRYKDRADPEQGPSCLMDYVSSHISDLWTQPYEDMEPKEAMARIGLCEQIQEAIADPQFSHMFRTASLYYWVKNTVEMNYATLLSRQRLLTTRGIAQKME